MRGHLYVVDMEPRIHTKPGKTRPCVVIQSDMFNAQGHSSAVILPITSKIINDDFLHLRIPKESSSLQKESDILVSQIIAISTTSFKKYIGRLPQSIFEELENRIKILLDFIP